MNIQVWCTFKVTGMYGCLCGNVFLYYNRYSLLVITVPRRVTKPYSFSQSIYFYNCYQNKVNLYFSKKYHTVWYDYLTIERKLSRSLSCSLVCLVLELCSLCIHLCGYPATLQQVYVSVVKEPVADWRNQIVYYASTESANVLRFNQIRLDWCKAHDGYCCKLGGKNKSTQSMKWPVWNRMSRRPRGEQLHQKPWDWGEMKRETHLQCNMVLTECWGSWVVWKSLAVSLLFYWISGL